MDKHLKVIAEELALSVKQTASAAELLNEGATVPFIARYRKEATGGLDEVEIISIRDRLEQLRILDKRREVVLKSLKERELLTPLLNGEIQAAVSLTVLEDIYLPFRPKRRTRGMMAGEKGLTPLADKILDRQDCNPSKEAMSFIDPEKGVLSADDALAGASDIIAERINEDPGVRRDMRLLFREKGILHSTVVKTKKDAAGKYRDYFNLSEAVKTIPSHRLLAVLRGTTEGLLRYQIRPDEESALGIITKYFLKGKGQAARLIQAAAEDGYSRLLGPSMETETRNNCKERADKEAISVFAENLRELLLAPPLGRKNILALDPGLRTGCKLVCLNRQGELLYNDVIYPFPPVNKIEEAAAIVIRACGKYKIEAVAVGSGTGGRETETFLKTLDIGDIPVILVNESGASVYSASKAARDEFPDKDITVRGSVSIGRRLMDPLSELIKIDPKSIGVGQYQHDVDQKKLKTALSDVVMSCVNNVGVELNTAGIQLLRAVSGISSGLASNIVSCRNENGPFKSRKDLKNVSGMGKKTFEQAAGFLRINDSVNPLDRSAVHPERYSLVTRMASDLGCSLSDLVNHKETRAMIDPRHYVSDSIGMLTLNDILSELEKPGRDPREKFEHFSFQDGVNAISDLSPGMIIPGIVTNVTAFGAFVDVGVHQDGLVHISCLSDKFVKNPNDIVKAGQKVIVKIIDVDTARKRISLSMKENS